MSFQDQLVAFNQMYGLPVNEVPHNLGTQRLKDLKQILLKEVSEIDDIIKKSELLDSMQKLAQQTPDVPNNCEEMSREILTDVADLMGDMQVYCGSELVKWGIHMEAVQYIIMASNMSKLGADGQPIVNAQGKVEKGPYYWKPEPLIKELLLRMAVSGDRYALPIAQELVATKRESLLPKYQRTPM